MLLLPKCGHERLFNKNGLHICLLRDDRVASHSEARPFFPVLETCHKSAASGGPLLLFTDGVIEYVFGRVELLGGLMITDGGGLELFQRPSWLQVLCWLGQ